MPSRACCGHWSLTACHIECWSPRAGAIRTGVTPDVYHAVLSVLLAERRCLAALDIKGRALCVRVMRATLVVDVDHAVLDTFSAERRLLALEINVRRPCAIVT